METETPDHAEIVRFLSDPATHGGAAVEVKRTHGAVVFLAGDSAYKIKRPVCYDYMDFSTLDARRDALQRELDLNRPAAGSIYHGLIPITQSGSGLTLGGEDDVAEWALHMRRFPAEAELVAIAEAGSFEPGLARDLGEVIARYHADAPVRQLDGPELVSDIIAQLADAFTAMSDQLDAAATRTFTHGAETHFARLRGLLDDRATAGHVRRCHGDLHMGNIVVLEGRPVPFDALEFDERLGTMDVLYDLAFLLMDLHSKGLHSQANIVLNRYLHTAAADSHYDALALLPLFLGLRAGIRAMVAVQRAEGAENPETALEEARGYLTAANTYLAPPPALLVGVGGLSGSGKSTLAARIAPAIGPAPGAVHLRSDLIRKQIFDVDEFAPLPESAYAPKVSEIVYNRLRERATRALIAGHGVVVDAVHMNGHERAETRALAESAGVDFIGLWLDADPAELIARVEARRDDVSDADAEVVRKQLQHVSDVRDWRHVDASGSIDATVSNARAALKARR